MSSIPNEPRGLASAIGVDMMDLIRRWLVGSSSVIVTLVAGAQKIGGRWLLVVMVLLVLMLMVVVVVVESVAQSVCLVLAAGAGVGGVGLLMMIWLNDLRARDAVRRRLGQALAGNGRETGNGAGA